MDEVKPTLERVKKQVEEMASKIKAPEHLLPGFGTSKNEGSHIEVDNWTLNYVTHDRGKEISREFAVDTNDLLYRVFDHITFAMASKYAANSPTENVDHRRVLFAHQVELLTTLDPDWGRRKEKHHEYILKIAPYDDNVHLRLNYLRELEEQGMANAAAWEEAKKWYPLAAAPK